MKKSIITSSLTVCMLLGFNGIAKEIKPPKTVANGDAKFTIAASRNILYFKLNNKQVFKVLTSILGKSQNKSMRLSKGKVLSESFNLEDGVFKMKRKVALADGAFDVDLAVDIDKSGKTDFTAQLDYKKDFTWTANHRRLRNMLVMQTTAPIEFKAVTHQDKAVCGKIEGKVNYHYLKEVTLISVTGPITIKAENKNTFIRLTSPASMGAKFQGAYIMVGLGSPQNKGARVNLEEGDAEILKFSITPATK